MVKSLRARLFVSYLAVIMVVFVLTAVAAIVPLRRVQARLELQRLENLTTPLVLQTGYFVRQRPSSTTLQDLLDFQAQRLNARLILFSRRGTVLYDTSARRPLSPSTVDALRPAIVDLAQSGTSTPGTAVLQAPFPTEYAGVHDGQRIVLAAVPGVDDRVLALMSTVRVVPVVGTLLRALTLAAGVGLLGALLATLFLSRSIARPITRLTRAADAVAAGDLGRRVPGEGEDEVGRLVHSFNVMVARLQASYESQRRLLANVAHELRTPLTSIQGYATALYDDVIASEAERREALQTISEESERVNNLVVQLLQLARLESGQAEPRFAPVHLAGVIERIIRRHRVQAAAGQIDLRSDVDADLSLRADEALLDQAIDNLVRNAIQHTPAGGQIVISASRAPAAPHGAGRLRLWVADTGDGISPEEIPHIFDRFYRPPPDGTTGAGGRPGFGLGLAIVQEIVASHGGSIDVESQPGRGTTFIIDLPLGPEPARAGRSREETR